MLKHRAQLNLDEQLVIAYQIAIMQDGMPSAVAARARMRNIVVAPCLRSIKCREISYFAIHALERLEIGHH